MVEIPSRYALRGGSLVDRDRRDRMLAELRPYIDRARSFSGWALEEVVRVTYLEPGPPWDYESLVRESASKARRVLDLGTGGAEFYANAMAGLGARAIATEEWHVNAPVAQERLRAIGGDVVRANNEEALPFRDGSFDMIIDRHEALEPLEVARALAPGGRFITQQVARENWRELEEFFPNREAWPDHFRIYQDKLRGAGLEVRGEQHEWRVAYAGLGDIVFMLLVAPWEVPGFDPEADIDRLMKFEDAVRTERGIEMTFGRYLIVADKPGA